MELDFRDFITKYNNRQLFRLSSCIMRIICSLDSGFQMKLDEFSNDPEFQIENADANRLCLFKCRTAVDV